MPQPILNAVIPNAKVAWVASDTLELPRSTVGVRVASGGTVAVEMWGTPGEEAVPLPVLGGEYVVGQIRRILATGTTASGFVIDYIAD